MVLDLHNYIIPRVFSNSVEIICLVINSARFGMKLEDGRRYLKIFEYSREMQQIVLEQANQLVLHLSGTLISVTRWIWKKRFPHFLGFRNEENLLHDFYSLNRLVLISIFCCAVKCFGFPVFSPATFNFELAVENTSWACGAHYDGVWCY